MRWDEAALPALAAVTPAANAGEKTDTPEDLLRRALKVTTWTPSLTLLYFHTPHEGLEKSKLVGAAGATLKQCKSFSNEKVARWLSLFHCVEVDMGRSDAQTAERLGYKEGVMFSFVDQELNVIATSKSLPESEALAGFLKNTLRSEACAKFWTPVQSTIDEQKKALAEARDLMKKEKYKEALDRYRSIIDSGVRVADFFDDAAKESVKAQRKAEQQS